MKQVYMVLLSLRTTGDKYNGFWFSVLYESVQYTEISDSIESIALQLIVVLDPSVRLVEGSTSSFGSIIIKLHCKNNFLK